MFFTAQIEKINNNLAYNKIYSFVKATALIIPHVRTDYHPLTQNPVDSLARI